MSKERLEEIQKEVNYAYRRDGSINTKAVTMHIEYYEYLYKQAERVQELEKFKRDVEQMYGYTHLNAKKSVEEKENLQKQNKRYRATINAMGQILKDAIHALDVGEKVQGLEYGVKIANDALESEPHE